MEPRIRCVAITLESGQTVVVPRKGILGADIEDGGSGNYIVSLKVFLREPNQARQSKKTRRH